ncbi:MAG: hypothetical protein JNG49_05685 [Peptostreptococcus stomatis]|uniref:hypothetical protein n=1 Tax=Peptostreptococcus stomatis TaxID=341694 RepID=UPI001A409C4F|nr:hypothetical protein [Peptostreptococcus stomatis]MBL6465886.1 hypothetical protein [Peptostreptococcus stomatis]
MMGNIGDVFRNRDEEREIINIEKEIIKEAKLEQFKKIIIDINNKINSNEINGQNKALGLIFDYDKCNEYAKIVIDKTSLRESIPIGEKFSKWEKTYSDIILFNDIDTKIRAAKSFIEYCKDHHNRTEGYKFIFWSLIILTVDNNCAEEHLSFICDFAKLLDITNDEFEDIINVIKYIYNEVDEKYIFKSLTIKENFCYKLNILNPDILGESIGIKMGMKMGMKIGTKIGAILPEID